MTEDGGQRPEAGDRRSDVGGGTEDEPATRDSLPVTTAPSAWFGFRLRAYEAWKDLEKFFPASEFELKKNLEQFFLPNAKHRSSELLNYRLAGWWRRKMGGLKMRIWGFRERKCFRAARMGAL